MKRFLKIALISVMLMLISINISMAASGNAEVKINLDSSVTSVKEGETFTVSLSQECKDGIQGFEAILEYDSSVFQLTDTKYSSNWMSLGDENLISVITSNGGDVYSGEIVTFTFKALKNAQNSKITLKDISAIRTEGEKVDIGEKSVEITVGNAGEPNTPQVTLSNITISATPKKTTYNAGEKFATEGMKIMAAYSDNTTKEITNYTYEPTGELSTNNNTVTISYTENGVTKTVTQGITVKSVAGEDKKDNNDTQNKNNTENNNNNNNNNNNANKSNISNTNNTTNTKATAADATTANASNLPKTGNRTIIIAIVALAIVGIGFVSYKGYQKYKDI